MELRGKVALITGGGTGLGREIALLYAKAGADIGIVYSRSADEAEATARDLRALDRRVAVLQADVASIDQVQAMVDRAVSELGRIDVLVNNAGTTAFIPFREVDQVGEDQWDRLMNVNVKGAFFCSQAVAPIMKRQGAGKIVNISSTSALRPTGSSIPYSVSKAALTHLTKCLAVALGPEIAVNAIAPGPMMTRWWGTPWSEERKQNVADTLALQRIPEVSEVAQAALWLVESDAITGQTIVLDGGGVI